MASQRLYLCQTPFFGTTEKCREIVFVPPCIKSGGKGRFWNMTESALGFFTYVKSVWEKCSPTPRKVTFSSNAERAFEHSYIKPDHKVGCNWTQLNQTRMHRNRFHFLIWTSPNFSHRLYPRSCHGAVATKQHLVRWIYKTLKAVAQTNFRLRSFEIPCSS